MKFLKTLFWFTALLGLMYLLTFLPYGPHINAVLVLIALWKMVS